MADILWRLLQGAIEHRYDTPLPGLSPPRPIHHASNGIAHDIRVLARHEMTPGSLARLCDSERFFPIGGATVNYADVDQITYAALPADGVNALSRDGRIVPNLATNFAGQSASDAASRVIL